MVNMRGKEKNGENSKNFADGGNVYYALLFKYFNFVIVIAIIIILLVGSIYMIIPKYRRISRGVEEVNKDRAGQKEEMTNYLTRLNRYKRQYFGISESTRQRVDYFLPGKGNNEDLFNDMSALINRRGLILRDLEITEAGSSNSNRRGPQNPSPRGSVAGLGVINMKLGISGVDYNKLVQLLNKIETNLRLMDVTDIAFAPEGNSVNLSINTYYIK